MAIFFFCLYMGALDLQVHGGERANSLAGNEEPAEALGGMEVPFQSVTASTALRAADVACGLPRK